MWHIGIDLGGSRFLEPITYLFLHSRFRVFRSFIGVGKWWRIHKDDPTLSVLRDTLDMCDFFRARFQAFPHFEGFPSCGRIYELSYDVSELNGLQNSQYSLCFSLIH